MEPVTWKYLIEMEDVAATSDEAILVLQSLEPVLQSELEGVLLPCSTTVVGGRRLKNYGISAIDIPKSTLTNDGKRF